MPVAAGPFVGIFWLAPGDDGRPQLVLQRTPLSEGEPYGECIGHPTGHYEAWTSWQNLGVAGLKRLGLPQSILTSEYETYPRGRIVYSTPDQAFWIYADKRLQSARMVRLIRSRFGLDDHPTRVRSDAHYR
jgi:hypothetical protein